MGEPEVIAAIISLGGVILPVCVTLCIGLFTHRYNYHQLYAETVSKNRMEWINIWRENLSVFLACAEMLHTACNSGEREGYRKEMLIARGRIVMRLNDREAEHVALYRAIMNLDCAPCNENFYKQVVQIEGMARAILKTEWERVKKEAKGKKI